MPLGSLSLQAFTSFVLPGLVQFQRAAPNTTARKVVTVPNEKNLIPYQFDSEQDREEAAKNGRLGGRASGAARRRKRALKEAADLYLSLPVSERKRWNALAKKGVSPEDIDNQMAMIVGLTEAATAGDARAGRLIVDLLGESAQADPAADQLAKAKQLLGDVDSVIE